MGGSVPSLVSYTYSLPHVPAKGDYFTKKKVAYDKASLSVVTTEYAGSENDLKETMKGYTKLHKEPARFEWWSVVSGERKADDANQTKGLQAALDVILAKIANAKAS